MKKASLLLLTLSLVLFGHTFLVAQANRFNGNYPLATPSKSPNDLRPEYEKTMAAIAGAAQLADDPKTLAKKEDPEAYIKNDYKAAIEELVAYAKEIVSSLQDEDKSGNWKDKNSILDKIGKSAKSSKFSDVVNQVQEAGVDTKGDIESIYFIWMEYLYDKKNNAPWLDRSKLESTRAFRSMLAYVSKNYDRPFGAQAELGAVLADAAQAMSNCLENPDDLAWQGEGKVSMKKEDELRRLASDVSFYEWRMHDPINGRRSAHIDRKLVFNLKKSLYIVVEAMIREKTKWPTDPHLGPALQMLYNDVKSTGWRVDGNNAKKG